MIVVPPMFTMPEGIVRHTVSVEPEALHNGFRNQVPTDVYVRVPGPHIRAP